MKWRAHRWTRRLELEGDTLRLSGRYEYVMGFGNHYLAQPSVSAAQQ